MKVVGCTDKIVVVNLRSGKKEYTDAELDTYNVYNFDGLMLPETLKVFEDHVELVVRVVGRKRKTLKIFYNDAILVNRLLHRIGVGKEPE